jgi:hypothetical protein
MALPAASLAAERNRTIEVSPLQRPDLRRAVELTYSDSLAPRFTASLALAYDDAALYVAAHVVDDSPLVNQHDPLVDPERGWSGDALQIRMSTDPSLPWPLQASGFDRQGALYRSERIVHLTLWEFTGRHEPVLMIEYGMDFHGRRVLRGNESGVAFTKDRDNQGYTLEARIPWSVLNAAGSKPKAGDRLAFVAKPIWGDRTGTSAALSFPDIVARAGFDYQDAATWGYAQFMDARSPELSRTQSSAPARREKPLRLSIPVADPSATWISAGIFEEHGLLVRTLPPVKREVSKSPTQDIDWDGLDDDGRPLPAGHYVIKFVARGDIGQRLVTSLHNAGNPSWRTEDGSGAWGGEHGNPIAVAADGGQVYLGWELGEAGSSVIAVDPALPTRGVAKHIGAKHWGAPSVLEVGVEVSAVATDGHHVFVAQDGKRFADRPNATATNVAAVVLWNAATGRPETFAFGPRTLVVSRWNGTGRNLTSIAVRGQSLYAARNKEDLVTRFDWTTGVEIESFKVTAPTGIALTPEGDLLVLSGSDLVKIDATRKSRSVLVSNLSRPTSLAVTADGRICVALQGAAMQVMVFDATGKPLGSIGRRGGRPVEGIYDASGMLNPAAIAIDSQGHLWVAENDATPRRFSVWTLDGHLVADLLGPGHYATMGGVDPANPRRINVQNTLFDVDYDTGQWNVLSTLIHPRTDGVTPTTDFQFRHLDVRHVAGRTYVIQGGRQVETIYLLDDATLIARPIAALGNLRTPAFVDMNALAFPPGQQEEAKRRLSDHWQWTDTNGDGHAQLEELTDSSRSTWGLYWGSWLGDDLSIWSATMYGSGDVYRIPVASWLPNGAPVYPEPGKQAALFKAYGSVISSVMPGAGGDGVYVLEKAKAAQDSGSRWEAVSKYDLSGKRLWSYRPTWTEFALEAPLPQPGLVIGAFKFIGEAKLDNGLKVIGVNGYYGQFNLLTSEGLWVAALGKDSRTGPAADENAVWCENFSGTLFRNRDNGKVYLMGGETDLRIWEVTGLDSMKKAEQPFDLRPEDVQAAVATLPAATAPATKRIRARSFTPVIDGEPQEWSFDAGTPIDGGEGRSGRIHVAYDQRNLYIMASVDDASPWANAGSDYGLLFTSGDSINLMLSTPEATRILIAPMNGETATVIYRSDSHGKAKEARTFSSPTGSVEFAAVTLSRTSKAAVSRQAGHYVVEASIPLSEIGIHPVPGTVLRGDVGIVFSDASGRKGVRRSFYYDHDTAIINDIPSEARLAPSRWGDITFE